MCLYETRPSYGLCGRRGYRPVFRNRFQPTHRDQRAVTVLRTICGHGQNDYEHKTQWFHVARKIPGVKCNNVKIFNNISTSRTSPELARNHGFSPPLRPKGVCVHEVVSPFHVHYIGNEKVFFFFGPIQTFKIFSTSCSCTLSIPPSDIVRVYSTDIVNMYVVKLWSNILRWLIFTFWFNYIGIRKFFWFVINFWGFRKILCWLFLPTSSLICVYESYIKMHPHNGRPRVPLYLTQALLSITSLRHLKFSFFRTSHEH